MSAPVDVLAVVRRARDVLAETYARYQLKIGPFASQAQRSNVELRQAEVAIAALIEFNRSLVLNGRQRFNATPEQIALSDAAEAALANCGSAKE